MFKKLIDAGQMRKCFVLMFFILVFSCDSIFAVTINGQEISSIIKPNEVLVCTNSENNNNMAFSMKDGAIAMGRITLTKPQDIKSYYQKLESQKDKLARNIAGTVINMRSGTTMNYQGAYMTAGKQILLSAATKIDMVAAILKTQEVVFTCLELNVHDAFVEADVVAIRSNSLESIIQEIRIHFNKNTVIPNVIDGVINFAANQIDDTFIAVGAQKIEFVFAPHAFN